MCGNKLDSKYKRCGTAGLCGSWQTESSCPVGLKCDLGCITGGASSIIDSCGWRVGRWSLGGPAGFVINTWFVCRDVASPGPILMLVVEGDLSR